MGGLLQLFNFNKGGMAKKILTDKKHVGGLEAPRNSLELQVEASQSYSDIVDLPVEEDWLENSCYPPEALTEKIIDNEVSKCTSSTRRNEPSIVARLMGMETVALEIDSMVKPMETKNENKSMKPTSKNKRGLKSHISSYSNSSQQIELDFFNHNQGIGRLDNSQKLGKLRRQEHPQEEELQKFKKEFEAWQAASFKECLGKAELVSNSISSKLLAQENLKNEKNEHYVKPRQKTIEKPAKPKGHMLKSRSLEGDNLQHQSNLLGFFPHDHKGYNKSSRSRTLSRDFEESIMLGSKKKLDACTTPTRIVVLKPGPDRLYNHEESWTSPSGTSDHGDSLEGFLEEVKERLKCEMQGKTFERSSTIRGSGIETPYSEKSSNHMQIAQNITKRVNETISRDIGMNLRRSESTRSYRSEIQFNEPCSPEFMSRNTRKLSSERLRNVLKRETDLNIPSKVRYCKIMQDEQEMQTRSFRHGLGDDRILHKELSPRNLVRSLSAPVSGTSLGKLLLKDRHLLTGAHIQRKHEAVKDVSLDLKKQKKKDI